MELSQPGRCGFDGVEFAWTLERRGGVRRSKPRAGEEWFDAGQVGSKIRLRHWQPGDRFQPIGMKQAVKLQDLFTNAKIPAAHRRVLVVAESEAGELFWVEELRIGERFKLGRQTRVRLKWNWRRKA